MIKNKIKFTRSSGFTLIELLVVVAILGILAAVGTVSYNGYVKSAKLRSAENILQQVSLAQLEYYTNLGEYYLNASSCSATETSHEDIGTELFDDSNYIAADEMGFNFCTFSSATSFTIIAEDRSSNCKLTLVRNKQVIKENC